MQPDYIHLIPGHQPPPIQEVPFRAILIADLPVPTEWMRKVADWLVAHGCLYFVAWGVACESWHDSVDWSVLETHNYGDIPDDRFVMTTWHRNEALSEALWFLGHCATHPDVELVKSVILHVAAESSGARILDAYTFAQEATE